MSDIDDESDAGGDDAKDSRRIATRLTQAGRRSEWTGDPRLGGAIVNPPVWRASTILFDDVATMTARSGNTHDQLFYGRRGTPTQWALADALTQNEPGAAGTLLYPSGVAAITSTLLALLAPGDELLMVDSVYEPTRLFCQGLLQKIGVTTRYYDPQIGAQIDKLISPTTKVIFCESPGSLTFEIQDLPAITNAAHTRKIAVLLDNTWATSLLFPALAKGADVSIISLSKYVGGHSDAMMGAVTTTPAFWPILQNTAYQLGQTVAPDDCALILRGLRTLDVRLERHQKNGLLVAQWLQGRHEVGQVLHPAIPSNSGYKIWQRDFAGASGVFSFTLKNQNSTTRERFINALRHFGIGYSWGGYESLAIPVNPEKLRTATRWSKTDPLVRLSVGLEDPADLIADLEQGFAAIGGQS